MIVQIENLPRVSISLSNEEAGHLIDTLIDAQTRAKDCGETNKFAEELHRLIELLIT